MRIVIDLQGAQTESRYRGIGRYSISLAKSIVKNRGNHEIIIALNGLFPETVEPIRAEFNGLIGQESIQIWHAPGPVKYKETKNALRRNIAEQIREAFLVGLRPDIVLITSLFEGFGDDAVTSIGQFEIKVPTAIIVYDLIPYFEPEIYLKDNVLYNNYYQKKIEYLKMADLFLAISNFSAKQVATAFNFSIEKTINISAAADSMFKKLDLSLDYKNKILRKYGILDNYIMYTGGADDRKNIHGLIKAFSILSYDVRKNYQLVLVGKMPEGNIKNIRQYAKKNGLEERELIFTGYVSDEELVALYNICKLFVFPSFTEGFGFPPLEAMSCGTAVIASNRTSLPEVIGRNDLLFDPDKTEDIKVKIEQILTNKKLREELSNWGLKRAKEFSWDKTAQTALEALEKYENNGYSPKLRVDEMTVFTKKNLKILVVKLDHMGDFILAIPAITKLKTRYPYATIDIIVGSWNEEVAKLLKVFDSVFTLDFYKKKSSLAPSIDEDYLNDYFNKLPFYDIALDLRRQTDSRFIFVKAKAKMKIAYETFNNTIDSKIDILIKNYNDIPFEFTPLNRESISRQMLKVVDAIPSDINDYIYFPSLVNSLPKNKLSIAIFPKAGNDVKEWPSQNYFTLISMLLKESIITKINLYFSNNAEANEYKQFENQRVQFNIGLKFKDLISSLSENTICIANNSLGVHLSSYLSLNVVAIYGGHETSAEWGPVFGNTRIIYVKADCSPCHIAKKSDCKYELFCLSEISPDIVFEHVVGFLHNKSENRSRIEYNYQNLRYISSEKINKSLINSIVKTSTGILNGLDLINISKSIAFNIPQSSLERRLFIDVSEFVNIDAKTGIQRVVRNILYEWLNFSPVGWRVEPVYATVEQDYFYARKFTSRFLSLETEALVDEPIDYDNGDIFFALDLHPQVQVAKRLFYQKLRNKGVLVIFMVYDLLSVRMPQYFVDGSDIGFETWLEVVTENDSAICISKATADDLDSWIKEHSIQRLRPFTINWSHIGADLLNSMTSKGLPYKNEQVIQKLKAKPSFLMVSTIEPRKAHAQVISAFEQLWYSNIDVNLVIIGKQGWMVEDLVNRLRYHPELNKRIFWLEGISDEYLDAVYASSTCLIAASYGEGFGLPLIEAAQHKLPIIARDIPVFREVAGEYAYYFKDGKDPHVIVDAIKEWIYLYQINKYPKSDNMPWLTWKESAQKLFEILIKKR